MSASIVLNTNDDKSSIFVSTFPSKLSKMVEILVKRVVSLEDKSTTDDTSDVTVAALKSVTNASNSRNVSNDSPAPPITSDMSRIILE